MNNGVLTKEEKTARATEAQRKWRAKNPNYYRNRYKLKREQYAASDRRYYETHSEKRKENSRQWREANLVKNRETQAEYRSVNRDKIHAACQKWHSENSEKVSIRKRLYNQAFPWKGRAKRARRVARKLHATPVWLTKTHLLEIELIHAEASHSGLHVDHIVPLQGRNVCGLHVPWNLQLLTQAENSRKSNNF